MPRGNVTPPNPTGLCQCGCGQITPLAKRTKGAEGHAKGEHVRFVNGHNRRGQRKAERWIVVERGHKTPCWIWTGYVQSNGYGKATHPHKRGMTYAHRVVYEELVAPIPAGFDLDHLCRQRDCVNPAHLEPVPRGENLRRGYAARGVIRVPR